MLKVNDWLKRKQMKLLNNYVLIRPDQDFNEKIKFDSGVELFLDVSWEKAKHVSVTGIVVQTPNKLNFGEGRTDMPWKCDMELKVDDKVWMNWDGVMNALRSAEQKIEIGGQIHLLIPYNQIFVALRFINDIEEYYNTWKNISDITKYSMNVLIKDSSIFKVIVLNGYCLIEPVKLKDLPKKVRPIEMKSNIVEMPDTVKDTVSARYGRVAYCGKENQEYVDSDKYDHNGIRSGDVISFLKAANIYLEYSLHARFTDDKRLFYRMQRYLIDALIHRPVISPSMGII